MKFCDHCHKIFQHRDFCIDCGRLLRDVLLTEAPTGKAVRYKKAYAWLGVYVAFCSLTGLGIGYCAKIYQGELQIRSAYKLQLKPTDFMKGYDVNKNEAIGYGDIVAPEQSINCCVYDYKTNKLYYFSGKEKK